MPKNIMQLVVNQGHVLPTDKDILAIPKAKTGEYDLSEKEMKQVRTRIYSINKNNAANRRYRTMRDGSLLIVWRIN